MIRKKRVRVGEKARRVVPMVRLGDVMVVVYVLLGWIYGKNEKQELKN